MQDALRAWYAGLSDREAVVRYLPGREEEPSARGVAGRISRQRVAGARQLHRGDLVTLLKHPKAEPLERATAVAHAIDVLRASKIPVRPWFERQSFQLDEMQISQAASRSPVLFALQLISVGP